MSTPPKKMLLEKFFYSLCFLIFSIKIAMPLSSLNYGTQTQLSPSHIKRVNLFYYNYKRAY